MNGAFVPPWIKPANETENFLTGFQIGQRRALADAEVAERQMSMQMRAQSMQAEQALQAQRIAEEAQINRERIAATERARQEQAALKEFELSMKAQEAATQMQGFTDMQADIAAGMPEERAFARNAWKILGSRAGSYYAAKARAGAMPEDMMPRVADLEGVGKVLVGARGGFQMVKPTTAQRQEVTLDNLAKREQVKKMVAESARLYRLMTDEPSKIELREGETQAAAVGRIRMEWENLNNQIKAFTTPPVTNAPAAVAPPQTVTATNAPAAQVLPPAAASNLMTQWPDLQRQIAPAEPAPPKEQRVKGRVYRTPKGLYRWTGEGWEAPQ